MLAGSWRADPPVAELLPDELDTVLPLLTGSGAAALGWRSIRSSPLLAGHPAAGVLRDSARRLAVNDALRQRALQALAARFNQAGLTPILFKGWAAGRHYAETYLRPYGDFDLLVRPEELQAARDILLEAGAKGAAQIGDPNVLPFIVGNEVFVVDLHDALPSSYATSIEALFERAELVLLPNGASLKTPCPEDHLRLVIVHLLRHGGWRPLWLCDVAAMSEAAGPAFDWPLCLTADAVTRGWIEAVIALSTRLLNARISGRLPANFECPDWLVSATLDEWREPYAWRAMPASGTEFESPVAALKAKWPNPIRAMFMQHAPVTATNLRRRQLTFFLSQEMPRASRRLMRRDWWGRVAETAFSKAGVSQPSRAKIISDAHAG